MRIAGIYFGRPMFGTASKSIGCWNCSGRFAPGGPSIMTENLLFRTAVALLSAFVYCAGVWVQSRRVRKQIGRSPNLKPRGTREKMLWLGWFIVIFVWLGQPFLIQRELPGLHLAPWLLNSFSLASGLILVLAGYACTLWCYKVMGNAWRIGINPREKNFLVTGGPYRTVRHPIYLFQIVMLAGVVLLLPPLCSLAILLIHVVCVFLKAGDEESYLRGIHGKAYEDYLARTGRLLPKLARSIS